MTFCHEMKFLNYLRYSYKNLENVWQRKEEKKRIKRVQGF